MIHRERKFLAAFLAPAQAFLITARQYCWQNVLQVSRTTRHFFRQRIIPFMWHLIHFFHANTFPVHSVLLLCPNRGTNIWHSPSKISFFVFKTPNLALNWHLSFLVESIYSNSLFMVKSIYKSWYGWVYLQELNWIVATFSWNNELVPRDTCGSGNWNEWKRD